MPSCEQVKKCNTFDMPAFRVWAYRVRTMSQCANVGIISYSHDNLNLCITFSCSSFPYKREWRGVRKTTALKMISSVTADSKVSRECWLPHIGIPLYSLLQLKRGMNTKGYYEFFPDWLLSHFSLSCPPCLSRPSSRERYAHHVSPVQNRRKRA